jgi:hypothetical protein
MNTERYNQVIARADRVMAQLDQRDGAVRAAAQRERQRLNSDLKRRATRVGVAVLLISLATIVIGLITPIGMFGFLGAIGLAIGAAAVRTFPPLGTKAIAAPSADLANGEMVSRFDSYLYRSRALLPAPAQAELDRISAALPALRQTLERIETLDPNAQDARRLMSLHLPGLIDRYLHVPASFRSDHDGEGLTVDDRLVEGLTAGKQALAEIAEKLAKQDMMAFETHGRFIQSRYGEEGPKAIHREATDSTPE